VHVTEGTFQKVEKSSERMYGPKGIVVCGYPPDEHGPLAEALGQIGLGDRPFLFALPKDVGRTLRDMLASCDRSGMGEPSELPRALIMSGFTQQELHILMSAYRQAGLPSQLWATLTPISENWTLGDLLKELLKEAKAFRKQDRRD
jgi:hypothetical protein